MSLELRRGLMGNKTPIRAVEVTGGSIKTSWIPLAGAIVKWDWMSLDNPTGDLHNCIYFKTFPYQDSLYRTFTSNNGTGSAKQTNTVYCWFQYAYGHGAQSNWNASPYSNGYRMIYTWDSLNGKAGYTRMDGVQYYNEINNKKTTTSGFPLQLFCGRDATRMIIYKVELINQDGSNMTLIPTIKNNEVGFRVEETGEFLASDNGVPFTKYE